MQKPAGLKLRSGRWHISKTVRVGAKRVVLQESTGFRADEIEQAAAHLERRIAEAQRELIAGPQEVERTFDQAAVQYVLHLERRGKATDRAVLDLELLSPHIGTLPLSHVHQQTLRGFEDAMRASGRKSGTVGRAYRTAVAVLNLAARVLRDGNQPWLTHAVPRIVAPDWRDRAVPYRLTWDEQDRLIAGAAPHLVPPILFAVSTGARQAEITGLRWDWAVDAPGLPRWSLWWIPPEIRKGSSKAAVSDQDGRYLVCNATARSVIAGQIGKGAVVFPGPDGREVERFNNTAWHTALKRAGLQLRFHDLRHTFGERLASARVPWEQRKVLLGHRLNDVTAHYSAPGLAELVDMADRVTRETAPVLRPIKRQAR